MPFQGNPNAGAPDPALINMLFQQKQRREEMQWEREKYQIEAQRQAQLDAADQARKDEIHRLDTLTKRSQLVMDLEGFGKPIDSARRNAEAKNTPFTSEDLYAGGGGEDFAAVMGGLDPNADPGRVQESDAAKSYLAAQLAGASPIVQELNPGVDPAMSLFGAGQAVETQRGREASLAEGVKVADATRTEQAAVRADARTEERQKRADYRAEAIAIRRDAKEVEFENRFIEGKVKAAEKALKDGNEELHAILMQDAQGMAAQRDAKLTQGQPEWAGKNMALLVKTNSSLDNYVGMGEVLDGLIANPDATGTEAAFQETVGNAINVLGDLGAAVMPSVERYMSDANVPQDVRNTMYSAIARGVYADGTPIAASKLAAIRTRWLILNALDPGRVAVAQLDDMEDATQWNGFLVSQHLGQARMRAAKNELLNGVDSAQRSIRILRPEAEFDDNGRLRIKGSTPRNAAGDIFNAPQPDLRIPEPAQGATAMDIILNPVNSVGSAIEAAKRQLDETTVTGKKKSKSGNTQTRP